MEEGLTETTALHFKINLLKIIHSVHPNPKQIESYLNRLLDLNYKLIMEEREPEEENVSLNYLDDSEDYNNHSTDNSTNGHISLELSQI